MPVIRARFITEAKLTSWLIRAFTWSRWSHVEFEWDNGTWLGARYKGGVKPRPADYCRPSREQIVEIAVTEGQHALWQEFCDAQIGKPYDLTALFGIVLHRDWTEPDSWFCSELYCAAMAAAGLLMLNTLHLNRITPGVAYLSPVPRLVGG